VEGRSEIATLHGRCMAGAWRIGLKLTCATIAGNVVDRRPRSKLNDAGRLPKKPARMLPGVVKVGGEGLEPSRVLPQQILSLPCLPVSATAHEFRISANLPFRYRDRSFDSSVTVMPVNFSTHEWLQQQDGTVNSILCLRAPIKLSPP
jgi:hypothetical protein